MGYILANQYCCLYSYVGFMQNYSKMAQSRIKIGKHDVQYASLRVYGTSVSICYLLLTGSTKLKTRVHRKLIVSTLTDNLPRSNESVAVDDL